MKYQKILISILVVLALFGYIVCSIILFINAFEILDKNGKLPTDPQGLLGPALIYIINALNGLVGGIVAKGFGVKPPEQNLANTSSSTRAVRLQNLGSFIADSTQEKRKELFGFLYALGYILIGITSIAIWLHLQENTIHFVTNMATIFIGMALLIISSYFNPN